MPYDIDIKSVDNTVDSVLADIVANFEHELGIYTLSDHARGYVTKGFAESIAEALKDYDYNKVKHIVRRMTRLAGHITSERAFLFHPVDRTLTTTDVWFGLVAARWSACPLDERTGVAIGPEGRWCNFLRPCPPDDPDCEFKFQFAAGKSGRASR